MAYSKAKITIDLEEYQDLKKKEQVEGLGLNKDEYLSCTTALVVVTLKSPELVNRPPATGIVLETPLGKFLAKVTQNNLLGNTFEFTKA